MIPIIRDLIKQLIPDHSTVLDLGCGDGSVLAELRQEKGCQGYGVEVQVEQVLSCIQKGVSVYHGDINEGLPEFSDQSFDFVVMSQTLQVIEDPILLLKEMVRVGKQGLVIFPNFAYYKNRFQLLSGIAPKSKNLPYDWYNTPNIRVIAISDFKRVCAENGIEIRQNLSGTVTPGISKWLTHLSGNFFAKYGVFIIQKKS